MAKNITAADRIAAERAATSKLAKKPNSAAAKAKRPSKAVVTKPVADTPLAALKRAVKKEVAAQEIIAETNRIIAAEALKAGKARAAMGFTLAGAKAEAKKRAQARAEAYGMNGVTMPDSEYVGSDPKSLTIWAVDAGSDRATSFTPTQLADKSWSVFEAEQGRKKADAIVVPTPGPAGEAPVVVRSAGSSHTAIRLCVGRVHVHFIPLSSLSVEKERISDFHQNWEDYPAYPVRRAAEKYLAEGQYRAIEPQVIEHLKAIVADPATVYNLEDQPANIGETTMATAKKTAPATPAKKAAGKTAPAAKKAVAEKAPAKNGIATVVTGARPPKKNEAQAPARTAPARAPDTTKYKVADPAASRKGETAEYNEVALKLKTFTREQLFNKMVEAGKDPVKAKVKINDMVYFKIVVAA